MDGRWNSVGKEHWAARIDVGEPAASAPPLTSPVQPSSWLAVVAADSDLGMVDCEPVSYMDCIRHTRLLNVGLELRRASECTAASWSIREWKDCWVGCAFGEDGGAVFSFVTNSSSFLNRKCIDAPFEFCLCTTPESLRPWTSVRGDQTLGDIAPLARQKLSAFLAVPVPRAPPPRAPPTPPPASPPPSHPTRPPVAPPMCPSPVLPPATSSPSPPQLFVSGVPVAALHTSGLIASMFACCCFFGMLRKKRRVVPGN